MYLLKKHYLMLGQSEGNASADIIESPKHFFVLMKRIISNKKTGHNQSGK